MSGGPPGNRYASASARSQKDLNSALGKPVTSKEKSNAPATDSIVFGAGLGQG